MKNWKLIVGIALVALVSAGIGAGVMAYVQTRSTAPELLSRYDDMPRYRMPSRGSHYPRGLRMPPGTMHELMEESLSEALEVSPEAFEELLSESEDWEEVAEKLDLTEEQLQRRLEEARSLAIEKAVEEGDLDEYQAEWMREHMGGRWRWFGEFLPFGPRMKFFGRGGIGFHHPW
jgi:hypothetical protein